MASLLLSCLTTTPELAGVFSDESVLEAMLAFEAALARAEARLGVIPLSAADAIAKAAREQQFDAAGIAREAFAHATPAVPLVRMLRERAGGFAHHGATSQDLCDTAMVLLLRRARPILGGYQRGLSDGLRRLADAHAGTAMLARTLLQPAPPVTFGLKAAHWYSAVQASWRRFDARFDEALLLQFGGASGTLGSLGEQALAVREALAAELGLPNPPAPWHTRRDRIAAIVCSGAIYTGVLGKVARDIALLMQPEIGEAAEPGGASSSLPYKRNPAGCVVTLSAAARMPGLAAAFLNSMVQEHERAAGGWQAEWPIVAEAVQSIGAAIAAMGAVVQGLEVNTARMRANLDSSPVASEPLGLAEHFRRRLLEE
jgi:3-carboxy-cis,cis-muconate cycloisomerase